MFPTASGAPEKPEMAVTDVAWTTIAEEEGSMSFASQRSSLMGNTAPLFTDFVWSYRTQTPNSTCWVRLPLLALNPLPPPYWAVLVCVPTESEDVLKIACPEVKVDVPRVVEPSMRVTAPVGVPAEELTAVVNVTHWLSVDGLAEETTVVYVLNTKMRESFSV